MAGRRGRLAEILSLIAGLVAALLIGYALGTYFLRQVTAPGQKAVMEALSTSEAPVNGQARTGQPAEAGRSDQGQLPGNGASPQSSQGKGAEKASPGTGSTGSEKAGQGVVKQEAPLLTTLEDASYSKSSGNSQAVSGGNLTSSPGGTTGGPKVKLFKVQVGSFKSREDALQFAKKLEKDGYQPFVTKEAPYTAQVGAFGLQNKAQVLAKELQAKGYQGVRIVND